MNNIVKDMEQPKLSRKELRTSLFNAQAAACYRIFLFSKKIHPSYVSCSNYDALALQTPDQVRLMSSFVIVGSMHEIDINTHKDRIDYLQRLVWDLLSKKERFYRIINGNYERDPLFDRLELNDFLSTSI